MTSLTMKNVTEQPNKKTTIPLIYYDISFFRFRLHETGYYVEYCVSPQPMYVNAGIFSSENYGTFPTISVKGRKK
jgi:hypothetical protein